MNHLDEVARRKTGGQQGWRICAWERIGEGRDLVVTGGVPREVKTGPRKGNYTWRDVPTQKAVVTGDELDAEHARYEAANGNCGDCFGKGEVLKRWSAADGVEMKPCARCGGTGKAPNDRIQPRRQASAGMRGCASPIRSEGETECQ